jgi:polyisoprenoid-binding protein YceI
MNRLILFSAVAALALTGRAETFNIDTSHAEIGFSAKHMMVSNTKGKFNTFEGTIDYDLKTGTFIAAQGTIEAASIDTNHEKRDDHLKNEDFFNVTQFPQLTFKSTSVKKTGDNTFEVTGTLNILGMDKTVVLPVTVNGPVDARGGGKLIGIECSTVLNRRDLGITHAPAAVIGDQVKINIDLEAIYQP